MTAAMSTSAVSAEGRWVDDEHVLAAGRLRLSAGAAMVRVANVSYTHRERVLLGSGLDFAEAVGIGHDMELGIRFGFRLDGVGRGTRADEVARGLNTETVGTGLSVAANPELRFTWRALHGPMLEAGVEDRVVLPIAPDPNVTNLAGGWISLHFGHVARLDGALEGIVGMQSFASEHVAQVGFGAPLQLSANVTDAFFLSLVSALHYAAATPYTESDTRWITGLGAGYRLGACDVLATARLLDTAADFTRRVGFGLNVACRE
jgi:hypothetical protein